MKTLRDRQAGTASGLAVSDFFASWKKDPNFILWLYGLPGCVLCSTATEQALEERNSATEKAVGIAYSYFEFNNE